MRNILRTCFLVLVACAFIAPGAAAQDVFSNPAMEPQDEFQKTFTRARVLMRQGRTEDAIKEFKQASKLKNDQCAECLSYIGQMHLQTQNFKEAAAAFRQAAELKPANRAEMLNALGVSLYLQGDKKLLDEAAAVLKSSIELSGGKVVKAYHHLGLVLIKAGKTDEGIAALKSYLEASPDAYDAGQIRLIIANPKMAGENLALPFSVKS
ncbi:MAG TPA: tetratricopeptide repeat protein, partial [Blastocatellia bacterium]|nr:tetratricopeptide repeat protein [Blastocatellia bacterium]